MVSKEVKAAVAVTLIYSVITLITVFHHEFWCDEVNVWLILKNLPLCRAIIHIFAEGHPLFFYSLCYPLVKLGFSMSAIQVMCWGSCTAAVYLLMRFSPFPWFLNLAITFGSGMLYCFPVISRSYSILPLLIFGLAIVHKKLYEQHSNLLLCTYAVILLCIANTHIIMYGFSAAVFALLLLKRLNIDAILSLREIKNRIMVLDVKEKLIHLFTIVGLLLPLLSVYYGFKYSNSIFAIKTDQIANIVNAIKTIIACFYDIFSSNLVITEYPGGWYFYLMSLVIITLFILIFKCLKQLSLKYFIAALVSVVFQLFIYLFSYQRIHPNRVLIIPLMIIFFLWLAGIDKKTAVNDKQCKNCMLALTLLFVLSIPTGLRIIQKDYNENFSSAKEMAEYIEKNIPNTTNNKIYTYHIAVSLGVVYHLQGERNIFDFFDDPVKCYNLKNVDISELNKKLKRENNNYVILFDPKWAIEDLKDLNVVYITSKSIILGETFYLIKL